MIYCYNYLKAVKVLFTHISVQCTKSVQYKFSNSVQVHQRSTVHEVSRVHEVRAAQCGNTWAAKRVQRERESPLAPQVVDLPTKVYQPTTKITIQLLIYQPRRIGSWQIPQIWIFDDRGRICYILCCNWKPQCSS